MTDDVFEDARKFEDVDQAQRDCVFDMHYCKADKKEECFNAVAEPFKLNAEEAKGEYEAQQTTTTSTTIGQKTSASTTDKSSNEDPPPTPDDHKNSAPPKQLPR